MKHIGQLSVGKEGFDISLNKFYTNGINGNFDLYADIDASNDKDYAKCAEELKPHDSPYTVARNVFLEWIEQNETGHNLHDYARWLDDRFNSIS